MAEIDLSIELFGKRLKLPIIISSMTGGVEEAYKINKNLAKAAQITGIGMMVGSQKLGIENQSLAYTYQIREFAPDILLFSNFGAVHLNYGYGVKEGKKAIDMIGADGLVLYLNPLQEAIQSEGKTNFKNLDKKIKEICQELEYPLIIKETGSGISEDAARRLSRLGISGIDIAGAGGTSWSKIERIINNDLREVFDEWGIPTAESLIYAKRGAPDITLIASGGIRSGLDIAKALALGADVTGIALPLLKPALHSTEEVVKVLNKLGEELKVAMFCTGSKTISDLKRNIIKEV
jgi:isopentenyl-diphosphate delta-isomerase